MRPPPFRQGRRRMLSTQDYLSLIKKFRTTVTPHFPFVIIPSHTTAEELRQEKHFLFLVILAAAAHGDLPLQRILGQEVKKAISPCCQAQQRVVQPMCSDDASRSTSGTGSGIGRHPRHPKKEEDEGRIGMRRHETAKKGAHEVSCRLPYLQVSP